MPQSGLEINFIDAEYYHPGAKDKLQTASALEEFLHSEVTYVPSFVAEYKINMKFILIELPNSDSERQPRFLLVVGRPYNHHNFYEHKHMVAMVSAKLGIADPIVTGGDLRLSKDYEGGHVAKLCGRSGTYGVFDFRLLEHREMIAEALGMTTIFEFSEEVEFPKKT